MANVSRLVVSIAIAGLAMALCGPALMGPAATAGVAATAGTVSLWADSTVPRVKADSDSVEVELGVRFQPRIGGDLKGVRFYKGNTNTGTHTGTLWSATGTKLATATFADETASGWQTVIFAVPIRLTADTSYVASYHTVKGHYSNDVNYFATTGRTNGPLYAFRDGEGGHNGLFHYGSTSGLPNETWKATNYYVDVVFTPDTTATPSAAALQGWGNPVTTSDFNDLSGWHVYDVMGTAYGNQWGNRLPSDVQTANGILTVSGSSVGNTGGLAFNSPRKQGRWEIRMKVTGDQGCWRPVLLMWPDSGVWPNDGEIDFAEQFGDWGNTHFNLHYGRVDTQIQGQTAIDYTQWNDFAVEWTATEINGYLNGKQYFHTSNAAALPPGPMHPTIQLDGSFSCNSSTQMNVDWMKVYQ